MQVELYNLGISEPFGIWFLEYILELQDILPPKASAIEQPQMIGKTRSLIREHTKTCNVPIGFVG